MISQQIHCQSNHTSGITHTTTGEAVAKSSLLLFLTTPSQLF